MNATKVQKGYKQTEVGVIPEDWKYPYLGDIATVSAGGTPSRKVANYWNGKIPWITTSEINFNVIVQARESISESGMQNSAAKLVPKGSLLMALYGQGKTRGKSAILGIDATTNQACASIVIKQKALALYVFHFLESRYEEIRALSNSGSQNNLNGKIVRSIRIPVPSVVTEQSAVAAALSDTDDLIESLEQLLTKKRQIKQGAMQELLTGNRRLPGFSGDWIMTPIGQLAFIQRGASPRPIDDPRWFDSNSNIGWVRISDVTQAHRFLTETSQRLSSDGIKHSRPVPVNSLIMSICATVGRPIVTKIGTCIHDGFVVFDKLACDQKYLYYSLSHIQDAWSKHGQTGSQMNLNTGLINSTVVPVPPSVEEQEAIALALSGMDDEIAAVEAQLQKTRAIKQGMMQELLTGRIRLI